MNLKSSEGNIRRSIRHSRVRATNRGATIFWLALAGIAVIFFMFRKPDSNQSVSLAVENHYIWQVRSIDTMKNSRDQARARLNDASYDRVIEAEVADIKSLGANYVAIGTPYDDEFLPYLKKWVAAARKNDLKVWYRGTFSSYEGWFEYPKTMSPEQLLVASNKFITSHPELFEDGDIFDACPECENAGHWPQPRSDKQYNQFIQKKQTVLTEAFKEINKDVNVSYASIIGGRAKDVMDQPSFDALGKVVALDHYAVPPSNYGEYISYFKDKHDTKVLFSEVGAPIPDLHGEMNEEQQAEFMRQVFEQLYAQHEQVIGINYWVYNNGTTALASTKGVHRKVASVIEEYFKPGFIKGRVVNSVGDGIGDVVVEVDLGAETRTTSSGLYFLAVPLGKHTVTFSHPEYFPDSKDVTIKQNVQIISNPVLSPVHKDWRYSLQELWPF